MWQLQWSAEIAFRASGNHFQRLFRRERLPDRITQLDEIDWGEVAHNPRASEAGQFRER